MKKIQNKTIWIIGASSGIGLELAKQFAEANNYVFVTARNVTSLESLKARYVNNISVISGDVTSRSEIAHVQKSLYEQTDILDMVILCAGTCEYDDGLQLDENLYRRVFDVNFFSAVSCTNIALPLLRKSKGLIVGVSSLAAVVPFPRAEAYGASKAALEYFLDSLKVDLSGSGVGVTKVRPGFVDTPLTQKNDFDMPFIVDVAFASEKIIHGLEKGKTVIDFPWQLSWVLTFFANFKGIWMKLIARQFRKPQQL